MGKAWLRDLPEDLDMFIAQRDFERAMELIDRSELVVIPIHDNTYTLQCNNNVQVQGFSNIFILKMVKLTF